MEVSLARHSHCQWFRTLLQIHICSPKHVRRQRARRSTWVQEALLDGGAEALDEARVRAGVLQALAHVRQSRLRLRQVRHDVEELAHADATHRLVHVVLQALRPRAERPLLQRKCCMRQTHIPTHKGGHQRMRMACTVLCKYYCRRFAHVLSALSWSTNAA